MICMIYSRYLSSVIITTSCVCLLQDLQGFISLRPASSLLQWKSPCPASVQEISIILETTCFHYCQQQQLLYYYISSTTRSNCKNNYWKRIDNTCSDVKRDNLPHGWYDFLFLPPPFPPPPCMMRASEIHCVICHHLISLRGLGKLCLQNMRWQDCRSPPATKSETMDKLCKRFYML